MHMYSSPKLYYTYASSKGYNGVRDFYTSPFDSHTFSKFRQTFTFDIYFWVVIHRENGLRSDHPNKRANTNFADGFSFWRARNCNFAWRACLAILIERSRLIWYYKRNRIRRINRRQLEAKNLTTQRPLYMLTSDRKRKACEQTQHESSQRVKYILIYVM